MWKSKSLSRVRLFVTSWTIQSMEFSRPEYWSGSISLLQGMIPIQGLKPGLPHCRWVLYQLTHKGSPRILEWVAYHFSNYFNKWCWEHKINTYWTTKLNSCLTPLTKINLTSIKYLNIRPDIIKFMEENMGKKLFDIGLDNFFCMWHQKPKNKSKNQCIGLNLTLNAQQNSSQRNEKATYGRKFLKSLYWLRVNIQNI